MLSFVTGVVELLVETSSNGNKLQSIAMDLMPGGRQSTGELLSMIESNDTPKSFQTTLLAMNYLVKQRILRASQKKVDVMTTEMLAK